MTVSRRCVFREAAFVSVKGEAALERGFFFECGIPAPVSTEPPQGPGTKPDITRCPATTTRRTDTMPSARQYLLSQAAHCRRKADDCRDPDIAQELRRLAARFEEEARSQPVLNLQLATQMQ
jgi:hypothetical protein